MGKGKRKKATFEWVRDADEPVVELAHRPTRAERKAGASRAKGIADDLVALDIELRPAIPLGADVLEALEEVDRVPSKARGALARAIARVAKALRFDDLDAIEAAIAEAPPES